MENWITAAARSHPGAALVEAGKWRTFAQLAEESGQLARTLAHRHGVRAGDHVGVLMLNGVDYARIIWALIRLGAVIVPLNTRLTPAELSWQLVRADCAHLIHDVHHVEIAAQITPGDFASHAFDDIIPADNNAEPPAVPVDLNATFAIVFTSGTSGKPKGAELTYGSVFYSAMASAYRLGTLPGDRWLCTLPLYHVGGLSIIIRALLYGIQVELHHRFDVDQVARAMRNEGVTLVSLVPTMLFRLLETYGETGWSRSLRMVLLGGAAASPELLARCESAGIPTATTYGLTEAASQVATMRPTDAIRKPGSVGKPLLFNNVRILNENGSPAPPGEYGEVVVSGPVVMRGYYRDDEATAKILRDGELHTGDIGYLDADGDLWLVQRRSDLIVSGGENVYPAEVEAVLREHPAVKDACVVGMDNAEWGQQVAAAVVIRPGMSVDAATLSTFTRQRLAGYKQPRLIRFVDDLPQTASGKIQRHAVKGLF